MLNELVNTIIEINIRDVINFDLPINELFGLKIRNNNESYEFIIKLSQNKDNLIFFCDENIPFQIISSKPTLSFLNQEQEIKYLTEKLFYKEKKIKEIQSRHDSKINNLNEMIISKDSALISLTNKIEELIKVNNSEELQHQIEQLTTQNVSLNEVVASKDDEAKVLNDRIEELTSKNVS
ncbi:hypothetical protein, partial [Methanobrevibacter millerae]